MRQVLSAVQQVLVSLVLVAAVAALWVWVFPDTRLLGWFGLDRFAAQEASPGDVGGGGWGRGGRAAQVVTVPLEPTQVERRLTALGDGLAFASVDVVSQVGGTVAEILVTSNATVRDGQALIVLEQQRQQLAIDRAEQELARAQRDLARAQDLRRRGAGTAVTLLEAEDRLRNAELDLRERQLDLADRTLRAPIAGRVGLLTSLSPGMQVQAGAPLTQISVTAPLLVVFNLPARAFGEVVEGQEVMLRPLADPTVQLAGRIFAKDTQVDPATRTFIGKVQIPNADGFYRPGMAFELDLRLPRQAAYAVPPVSVRWDDQGAHIWLAREGKAVKRPVEVLQIEQRRILIAAEVLEGDQVVSEGMTALRPGQDLRSGGGQGGGGQGGGWPRGEGGGQGGGDRGEGAGGWPKSGGEGREGGERCREDRPSGTGRP